ncbi:MAG: hypothetical protein OHK0011_21320 [Turneriella sp.]
MSSVTLTGCAGLGALPEMVCTAESNRKDRDTMKGFDIGLRFLRKVSDGHLAMGAGILTSQFFAGAVR